MNAKVFSHKLTHNQFGEIPLGLLLATLNHLVPQSIKLLKINMDRYRMNPQAGSAIPNTNNPEVIFQVISDIFPSFPFVVATQLKSQAKYEEEAHQFQVASIGSVITHYKDQLKHIDYFLKKIDTKISLINPEGDLKNARDYSYLPNIVKGDLILLSKGIQWQPSDESHDRIETYYCLQGLSQIFLRYYFDLIVGAETDDIAEYIDDLFLSFFVSLRYKEQLYWQGYPHGKKVRAKVKGIIMKDSAISAHPILKKTFFDEVDALNPIIHDGSDRKMSLKMKSLLNEQTEVLYACTPKKVSLFLRILANAKDARYVRFLLMQVAKVKPELVADFQDLVQASSEEGAAHASSASAAENKNKGFSHLKSGFIEKVIHEGDDVLKAKEVSVDDANLVPGNALQRHLQAEKNMRERANIAAYTHEQLDGHLKNYFDHLHQRLGTRPHIQAKSKAHLENFTKNAIDIVQKEPLSSEDKVVFEESIDMTLLDLGNFLGHQQLEEYQEGIQEIMTDFETVEVNERMEKIEEVGRVLNAAVEISEINEEANARDRIYQETLAMELQIDDNPEHVVTVEKFLSLPIPLVEKMRYLHSHTPDPISIKMHRVVQEVQNICSSSSPNPVSIYKGNALLQKALVRLLFPHNNFKILLQKEIIPILPDKNQPPMVVRDFFSFPLAEKRKGPLSEEAWFEQHLFYLEKAKDEGALKEDDYEVLVENVENFPILQYKKYYNIMRKKKLEDTTFMAVYSLWQNNGLQKNRIEDSNPS